MGLFFPTPLISSCSLVTESKRINADTPLQVLGAQGNVCKGTKVYSANGKERARPMGQLLWVFLGLLLPCSQERHGASLREGGDSSSHSSAIPGTALKLQTLVMDL